MSESGKSAADRYGYGNLEPTKEFHSVRCVRGEHQIRCIKEKKFDRIMQLSAPTTVPGSTWL